MATMKIREAQIKKCMKVGHDWAFQLNLPGEYVLAKCLRCGAEQYFFLDQSDLEVPPEYLEVNYDTDMDDDSTEDQTE